MAKRQTSTAPVDALGAGRDAPADIYVAGRSDSLSSQIIADVRQAVLERRLKAGDILGTEKDLAERYGVSRMAARDALQVVTGAGHRRDQDGQRRRRPHRSRQPAAIG